MRAFRSGAQRLRLYRQLPPRRCTARSSRTGQPCRNWALIGATVCGTHGARAPQVRAAAQTRISLAEALVNGERRPLGEVLADSIHAADVLARQLRDEIGLGSEVTAAQVERLVGAIERTARLSKVGLDAGIDERRVRLAEAQAGQMFAVFTRILTALNLTPEQRARVPELVRREIRGEIEGQVAS